MNVRARVALALTMTLGLVSVDAGQQINTPTPTPPPSPAATRLAAVVDPVISAVYDGFDPAAGMDHVRFMSQYWRLAGNTGYNATIDRIQKRLEDAGIATRIDEYPNTTPAWDYSVGTVALVAEGKPDQVVLSREQDRVALCINSFSTPAAGVVAPIVDVGRGAEQDYAGKDIKGAVVLGDADSGALWRRAVTTGGAIGVIATALPSYLNPDPPGVANPTPRDQWGILQWNSIPYDEARKGFAFKATPRAAVTLRKRIAEANGAPVSVRVTVASTFTTGPVRTLIGEIPGRSAAAERIVMAAHIQEPGANDNASGVATLAQAAISLASAIHAKTVAPPERTLTFLFLNEISGSRRWLQDHPAEAKQTRYMFSLDMTGEDVSKTGGSFLIERYPDPGAVWARPWDPHTEWGAGNVRADSLKGDLINDLHMFVIQRVARRSKWAVKTNPYEGGSDHTVFQGAGIPSVLDWHFTDRYYHSNLDTLDKTSAREMQNVGTAVAASAWLMASATPERALDAARVVADAGRARVTQEQTEGAKLAAAAADPAAARARETTIVAAWKKWYAEAVRSASRLIVGAAPATFQPELDKIAAEFSGTAASNAGSSTIALSSAWLGWTPFMPATQTMSANGVFVCGVDQQIPPIAVTWMAMVLIGDDRMYMPCPTSPDHHPDDHREVRESKAFVLGLSSKDDDIRWRANQAMIRMTRTKAMLNDPKAPPGTVRAVMVDFPLGHLDKRDEHPLPAIWIPVCLQEAQYFESFDHLQRWQAGLLFHRLLDDDPRIRAEAAYSIGTRMAVENLEKNLVTAAVKELHACWLKQDDPSVQGVILATVGAIRYANDEQRQEAEAFLVKESQGPSVKVLGAAYGLEAMIRRTPQQPLAESTRARLRELVTYGKRIAEAPPLDADARIRRLAVSALMTARDTDLHTYFTAAGDDDWQMRRLVAGRLSVLDPAQAAMVERIAVDPAFQVRYDFLSAVARSVSTTKLCAPLVDRFKDPNPFVVMRAMDLINANCTDLEDAVKALGEPVKKMMREENLLSWHVPSRALAALARVAPDEAKPALIAAMKHPVWQVRATIAATAVSLSDEELAIALMADPEPNVRTAALDALARLKSPAVVPYAIATLNTAKDYQLLRGAALALKSMPLETREEGSAALLGALKRLTEEETDTSRDPREAIIERLGEVLPPERSSDLLYYVADYDDAIVIAAKKAFEQLVGAPPAVPEHMRRRYPYQPTTDQLSHLPTEAIIQLDSGVVSLRLLSDVAPVTVARFAELATQGFYNERTFHRVVPNFVVQGGSPGANEYVGAARYMRDEVGPEAYHIRGAVGISSRGTDSGDGQIFIDLVDLPRLDRDYTVFAYVTKGMDLVDQLLEGGKIQSITVK